MDPHASWVRGLGKHFDRVVFFAIEGTSARVSALSGVDRKTLGTRISLSGATPLRWALEAAGPITAAGAMPGSAVLLEALGIEAPRAFVVLPLLQDGKLHALAYADNKGRPIALGTASKVFEQCADILTGRKKQKSPAVVGSTRSRGRRRPIKRYRQQRRSCAIPQRFEIPPDVVLEPSVGKPAQVQAEPIVTIGADSGAGVSWHDADVCDVPELISEAALALLEAETGEASGDTTPEQALQGDDSHVQDSAQQQGVAVAGPVIVPSPLDISFDDIIARQETRPATELEQTQTPEVLPSEEDYLPPPEALLSETPSEFEQGSATEELPSEPEPEPHPELCDTPGKLYEERTFEAAPSEPERVVSEMELSSEVEQAPVYEELPPEIEDASSASLDTTSDDVVTEKVDAIPYAEPVGEMHIAEPIERPMTPAQRLDAMIQDTLSSVPDTIEQPTLAKRRPSSFERHTLEQPVRSERQTAERAAPVKISHSPIPPALQPGRKPIPLAKATSTKPPPLRRSRIRRMGSAAALGLAIALLAVAPMEPFAPTEVSLRVQQNATVHDIARQLEERDVIRFGKVFRVLARATGVDKSLRTGHYKISRQAWPWQILGQLKAGAIEMVTFSVPEGSTVSDIARILQERGLVSAKEFEKTLRDPALLTRLGIAGKSAEGYLFPETYKIARGSSATQIAEAMLGQFYDVIEELGGKRGQGLHEIVTLASIVQGEASPKEMSRVAGVFQNRLEQDMRLESCATIQYILEKPKARLRLADLRVQSPYNTYLNEGLPPGPISNPGRAALAAVVKPEEHDYLFFVAREDGSESHIFSRTFAAHLENQQRIRGR